MQNDRLRTALGFAAKAGKCISGDFGAERAVKDKKALAIALDNGVSAQRGSATRECAKEPAYPACISKTLAGR